MLRDAAFFEAIWLFDELSCLKNNPYFEADIKNGFSAIFYIRTIVISKNLCLTYLIIIL